MHLPSGLFDQLNSVHFLSVTIKYQTIHLIPSLFIRLQSYLFEIPSCNASVSPSKNYLMGDFSSSAEFFVSVGVFAFLYCTFTLILYLGYQHVYRETTRGPIVVSQSAGSLLDKYFMTAQREKEGKGKIQ